MLDFGVSGVMVSDLFEASGVFLLFEPMLGIEGVMESDFGKSGNLIFVP